MDVIMKKSWLLAELIAVTYGNESQNIQTTPQTAVLWDVGNKRYLSDGFYQIEPIFEIGLSNRLEEELSQHKGRALVIQQRCFSIVARKNLPSKFCLRIAKWEQARETCVSTQELEDINNVDIVQQCLNKCLHRTELINTENTKGSLDFLSNIDSPDLSQMVEFALASISQESSQHASLQDSNPQNVQAVLSDVEEGVKKPGEKINGLRMDGLMIPEDQMKKLSQLTEWSVSYEPSTSTLEKNLSYSRLGRHYLKIASPKSRSKIRQLSRKQGNCQPRTRTLCNISHDFRDATKIGSTTLSKGIVPSVYTKVQSSTANKEQSTAHKEQSAHKAQLLTAHKEQSFSDHNAYGCMTTSISENLFTDTEQTSVEFRSPVNISRDIPVNLPKDIPVNLPRDITVNIPRDKPVHIPRDIPVHIPRDLPVNIQRDISVNLPSDIPVNIPRDKLVHIPRDIPVKIPRDITVKIPRDIPVKIARDIPGNVASHTNYHQEIGQVVTAETTNTKQNGNKTSCYESPNVLSAEQYVQETNQMNVSAMPGNNAFDIDFSSEENMLFIPDKSYVKNQVSCDDQNIVSGDSFFDWTGTLTSPGQVALENNSCHEVMDSSGFSNTCNPSSVTHPANTISTLETHGPSSSTLLTLSSSTHQAHSPPTHQAHSLSTHLTHSLSTHRTHRPSTHQTHNKYNLKFPMIQEDKSRQETSNSSQATCNSSRASPMFSMETYFRTTHRSNNFCQATSSNKETATCKAKVSENKTQLFPCEQIFLDIPGEEFINLTRGSSARKKSKSQNRNYYGMHSNDESLLSVHEDDNKLTQMKCVVQLTVDNHLTQPMPTAPKPPHKQVKYVYLKEVSHVDPTIEKIVELSSSYPTDQQGRESLQSLLKLFQFISSGDKSGFRN